MVEETSKAGARGLHILVAVKGESASEITIRLAKSVLETAHGDIALIKVISHERKRPKAEALLERYEMEFAPQKVRKIIRVGLPSAEICQEAAAGEYDLVIIGHQTSSRFWNRLISRTTERVLKAASFPVLVARGSGGPLRRLLLCEGGRSTNLLPIFTTRLAPLSCKAEKIVLLHVMSQITALPGIRGWELRAGAEELIGHHTPEGQQLERDMQILRKLGVDVKVKVRHGVVVEEILSEAREQDYDVIVLGAPQLTGWQRYLMDDLIHKIVVHGQRPVLMVD